MIKTQLTLDDIIQMTSQVGEDWAIAHTKRVIERTKEIGVLRAIGTKSRTILSIFVMEGILQGLLSWLFASAALSSGQPGCR